MQPAILLLLILTPAPRQAAEVAPFPLDSGAWEMRWGGAFQPGTRFERDGGYDSGTFGNGEWAWKNWDAETGELTVEFTERVVWYILTVDREGNGRGARFDVCQCDGARTYGGQVKVTLRRAAVKVE